MVAAQPRSHQTPRPEPPRISKHNALAAASLRFASDSITQGDIVYAVYVGRRGRQRAGTERLQAAEPRDRMARVQASDEVWAAFRAQLGMTPVSVALGRLVEREVGQAARRSATHGGGVHLALEDAREVADELATLIARLEKVGATPASPPTQPAP